MKGHAKAAFENAPSLIVRGRLQDWLDECWVGDVVVCKAVVGAVVITVHALSINKDNYTTQRLGQSLRDEKQRAIRLPNITSSHTARKQVITTVE